VSLEVKLILLRWMLLLNLIQTFAGKPPAPFAHGAFPVCGLNALAAA